MEVLIMSERVIPVALSDGKSVAPTQPLVKQTICKLRCKGCTIEIYNGIQSRVLDTLLKAVLNYG